MKHNFHVNLAGMVDLLSHHLYSSPRVYLRELLQNSVDAITARRKIDAAAPAHIWIETPAEEGVFQIHDTGMGLTENQVHEFLATIGHSSKRDDLGYARHDFLGQFGIGLLSCFMIAEEITVITRSAQAGMNSTVVWRGHSDGHYTVTTESTDKHRAEPGTTVQLRARPGCGHWLSSQTVTDLAHHYGGLLPYEIRVGTHLIGEEGAPWEVAHSSPEAKRTALLRYGRHLLGKEPFDVVELSVKEAGLRGVAFILPEESHLSAHSHHQVYLKKMLLGDRVEKLLPSWAFFAQCVVDTSELRPTASREQLYEDELLENTREQLGAQLHQWLMRLDSVDPARLQEFLQIHHRGVMALALHDEQMLRLVDRWVAFETNEGTMPLAEFRRRHSHIRYTHTVEEFRQLAHVMSAQGLGLVNGGYAYASDVLTRLPVLDSRIIIERLDIDELTTHFESLEPVDELNSRIFMNTANSVLAEHQCIPVLREFEPPSVPVLHLENEAGRIALNLANAQQEATDAWSGVLSSFDHPTAPIHPQLVLNYRNPLVRKACTITDPVLITLIVEALYGQSLLARHRPLRRSDVAALNRSFLGLVEHALGTNGEG